MGVELAPGGGAGALICMTACNKGQPLVMVMQVVTGGAPVLVFVAHEAILSKVPTLQ